MIRVGVAGAGGWAGASHLPALRRLPEFEVTAVATTRRESAERAAAAHGVRHAFAGVEAMAAHPEVDLVVVSVKAPEHAKAIRAALDAGKHVLSEWPLGADTPEAEELAAAAAQAGVLNAVVLQGHHLPGARFVADLLAEGRIGRVESLALVASGAPLGGGRIPEGMEWSTDPAGGTSLLTIMAGHSLATLDRLVAPFTEVSARLPRHHDRVAVGDTGRTVPNGVPGQVLLHGLLEGGASASVTVHGGGAPAPDPFHLRIVGERGTLTITPVQPGMYLNWADWAIDLSGEPLPVPDAYRTVPADLPAGPVASVAAVYAEVARAVAEDRPARPDFATAARHHRLLTAIEESAADGGVTKEIP
ncbi:Gfo/Idh/MocA family protein [Actinomadura kijaniata]|uniref:Gfo/Idh/MocA family protein n=1 Tax=Actinomadura kijaniata TaxID=46161 RepID=UPI000A041F48|nr:Gfo/Idh/MocA family oxidoreductase [Actinomadura kijaniata]